MSSKLNPKQSAAFHQNATPDGRPLEPQERLQIFKHRLPSTPTPTSTSPSPSRPKSQATSRSELRNAHAAKPATQGRSSKGSKRSRSHRKRPMRSLIASQLHLLVYTLIHFFFSIYIRLRRAHHSVSNRILSLLYYHHRTPELIRKDVQKLDRVPEHLSVVLQLQEDGDGGLERLVNDVSEIAAWCAAAQVPVLSVYEKSGILKSYLPQTHRAITRSLHSYFGPPPARPTLSLRAPQSPSFSPPSSPLSPFPGPEPFHLNVLLLSADDGRSTLVDLPKTLTEMSQRGKLAPEDISSELIDAEIREGVMGEPDLLVLFGERVVLEGYPPWQVRLTEIFHVPDNTEGVGYQVFLRALHRFAKAQMRFGR